MAAMQDSVGVSVSPTRKAAWLGVISASNRVLLFKLNTMDLFWIVTQTLRLETMDRTDRRLLARAGTCRMSENSTECNLVPLMVGRNKIEPILLE